MALPNRSAVDEAWRWLAWLDGMREMEGTPYQAAQRVARRIYETEAEVERLREAAMEAHRLLNQDKRYTYAEAVLHAALWPGANPAFEDQR